ncbi:hypothetical protein AOLI_G00064350 [Acnodon oligacanthus]
MYTVRYQRPGSHLSWIPLELSRARRDKFLRQNGFPDVTRMDALLMDSTTVRHKHMEDPAVANNSSNRYTAHACPCHLVFAHKRGQI